MLVFIKYPQHKQTKEDGMSGKHASSMGNMRKGCKRFVRKHKGKGPFGKTNHRMKQSIKKVS
jgi:hypothetical protein